MWFLSLSRSPEESWWPLSKSAARAPLCSKHQRANQESVLPFDKEWVADLPKALALMILMMMLIIPPYWQSVTWAKLLFHLSQNYCMWRVIDGWERGPWNNITCIYIYNVSPLSFHCNKLVSLPQREGNDSSWGKQSEVTQCHLVDNGTAASAFPNKFPFMQGESLKSQILF